MGTEDSRESVLFVLSGEKREAGSGELAVVLYVGKITGEREREHRWHVIILAFSLFIYSFSYLVFYFYFRIFIRPTKYI